MCGVNKYILIRLLTSAVTLSNYVFNFITGINQSKFITKHISCMCEFKFDGRKGNLNQMKNNVSVIVSAKVLRNIIGAKKITFRILLHVALKMINM